LFEGLQQWSSRVIDAVSVNRVTREERAGTPYWVKRRRAGMSAVVVAGNLFLRWSHSGIRMFASTRAWQAWEAGSFSLLHGGEAHAMSEGRAAVCVQSLPGRSLREIIADGGLDEDAVHATAMELRRCHALHFRPMEARWSHGDPHLGNVVYDASTRRARLIDFETRHIAAWSEAERHADDLLVLLLGLMGELPRAECSAHGARLLRAYGEPSVVARTIARLAIPRGWERVLWAGRTNHLPTSELTARLSALRASLT
jgi:hypothetical protein